MPHKLGFTVVYASGEDENHRARELEAHGPTVRGWQSARHCSYPQEVVLRLDCKAVIHRVQILTHQYLIPQRVEFFVGNDEADECEQGEEMSRVAEVAGGEDEHVDPQEEGHAAPRRSSRSSHHHQPHFTHLGFVPLSSNEATGFKARELKSVSVSCTGHYLRLLLHTNHPNALNTWNQGYHNVVVSRCLPHRSIVHQSAIPTPIVSATLSTERAAALFQELVEVGLVAVNLLGEEVEDNNNCHQSKDEEMAKREAREDERELQVNGDEADRAIRNNCHTSSSQSSSSTSPFASPSPLSSLLYASSRCGGPPGNINDNFPRLLHSRNYTSPYDDLAFEMYVDTEVATIIRHMEIKKREAVEGERFEYARKLKLAMDELRTAGERLGRWALEKRKAADAEDFERARRKKLQIEEFRAHVYTTFRVVQLMEIHGPLSQNDDPDDPVGVIPAVDLLGVPNSASRHPTRPPTSPSRQQIHQASHMYQNSNCRQHQVQHRHCTACISRDSQKGNSNSTSQPASHSPPPAHLPSASHIPPTSLSPPLGPPARGCTSPLGSPPSNQRTNLRGSQKKKKATVSPTVPIGSQLVKSSYEAYDERTVPALRHQNNTEDSTDFADEWLPTSEGGSFRLSEREKRQATLPITVFGLPLVEKFYSKQYTEREEGLQMLRDQLMQASKARGQSSGRDGSEVKGEKSEKKKDAEEVPGGETEQKKEEPVSQEEAGPEVSKEETGAAESQVVNGEKKEDDDEKVEAERSRERMRQERVSTNKCARAAVFLLHRGLKDKVFPVYSLATEVIRFFFSQFVPSKRVSPGEVAKSVERLLPELIAKSGDCAPRVHNLAINTIIRMSECKDVREQHLIPMHITKPLTSSTNPRLALSRAEMAEQLILCHGISTEKQSGLTCRVLSELGCSGLHHPSEAVRKASERVLIQVYQVNPRLVRKQLPPEDDLTRRNLLYRHLFQEFERIDIQRKKDMLQKSKTAGAGNSANRTSPAGNNVPSCSYPSPAHTVSSSSSTSSSSVMTSPPGAYPAHTPLQTQGKTQSSWQAQQRLSPVPDSTNEDRMCVFCLERNKTFGTEEGLNLHYWRNCPMLTRCSHCRQVTEVSALTGHLLGECIAQQRYKQCGRCKLAITLEDLEEHQKSLSCRDGEGERCPLCYSTINPPGEEGWRAHLKGPGLGQCTWQSRKRHGRGGSKSPSEPKNAASKSTPSIPPPNVIS